MRLRGGSGSSRYQHFSEEALVALMSRNDTGALDAFYERVGHLAYGLALKIVGDEEIAQDVVCSAFLKLWQRAPAYTLGGARAQLLALVHRAACDGARDRPSVDHREGDSDLPAWIALEREAADQVLKLLADDERAVIELAYYRGRSRSEIAHQLAITVETVTGRVASGMDTLRRHRAANASVFEEAPLDEGETTPAPN